MAEESQKIRRAAVNPQGGKTNCVACVVAHIKNQAMHGGEIVVLADQVVAVQGIDPVHKPLSLNGALNYFQQAGITLSPKPVGFMDERAPDGHYAIFLRRPGEPGYRHVIYGQIVRGSGRACRKILFDPQSDTSLPALWADLARLGWAGAPYLAEDVR